MVDSEDRQVAVIELTEVRVVQLADVDLQHALDEGEGYESVAQWRAGREAFWRSPEVREELDDPGFTVNDDTLMVSNASGSCTPSERPARGVTLHTS